MSTRKRNAQVLERATESVVVMVSPSEKKQVYDSAGMLKLSVSQYFRQAVGLPMRKCGGAMPGAGRPRKQK